MDAQDEFRWALATVVENKEASADGTARTLVLSVTDAVVFADGRRVRHVQENVRWLDDYKYPGQYIAVRYLPVDEQGNTSDADDIISGRVAKKLFALASSPYEARSSSAALDAAIVEILVSRTGDNDDVALAQLGPGAQFQVSDVVGNGYGSLFNSGVGLQSAMEEGRPLVMVAVGCKGIAPLRACLAWTPVLAHATEHSVDLFYVAESPASAAYLLEWDEWREAGVKVHPLYLSGENGGNGASMDASSVQEVLEEAMFHGPHGLVGAIGQRPEEAAVMLSGVPGDVAAHLTRKLTHAGVASERLLFCDFF